MLSLSHFPFDNAKISFIWSKPMLKGQLQLFFHRKLSVLSSKTTFPVTLKMHSEKRMAVKAAEPLQARACQRALHLCVKSVQLFTRVQHSWQ